MLTQMLGEHTVTGGTSSSDDFREQSVDWESSTHLHIVDVLKLMSWVHVNLVVVLASMGDVKGLNQILGVSLLTVLSKHDNRGGHESPEDGFVTTGGGLQDAVELDNEERNGDEPINVTEAGRGGLHLNPSVKHKTVVEGGDTSDHTSDGHGSLPLSGNGGTFQKEEAGECQPERDFRKSHFTKDLHY